MKTIESIKITPGKVEGIESLATELEAIIKEIQDAVDDLGVVIIGIESVDNPYFEIEPYTLNPELHIDNTEVFDEFNLEMIRSELGKGGRVFITHKAPQAQRALEIAKQMAFRAQKQYPQYTGLNWELLSYNYPTGQDRALGWHIDGWLEKTPADLIHVQFTFGDVARLEVAEGTYEVESEDDIQDMTFSQTSVIPDFHLVEVGNHLIHRVENSGKTGLRIVMHFV